LEATLVELMDQLSQLIKQDLGIYERIDKEKAKRMRIDKLEVKLFLKSSLKDVVAWVKGESVE
jgi:hypothetical protein